MGTTHHVVINCQSTDINGYPTSIEAVLTPFNVDKDVPNAEFYCEIGGYNETVKCSPVTQKMFEHRFYLPD